jgi:hypothetical protein
MSPLIKLTSPKLRVILGDPDQPDTWRAEDVQTIGRDITSTETLFGVQKIGRPADHPVRSITATAYFGLVRTGKYQGSFDQFETDYVEISPIGQDEAFPTEPGPVPG